MNKFFGIPPGSLLDELNYLKKLGFDKNKENDDIWNKLCLNCDSGKNKDEEIKKFSSHPKRLTSDTEISAVSSRRTSISSKGSNTKVETREDVFEKKKLKIKSARKEPAEKVVQLQRSKTDFYRVDMAMGDSCSITPRKPSLTFYDNVEAFSEDDGVDSQRQVPPNTTSTTLRLSARAASRSDPRSSAYSHTQRMLTNDSAFDKKLSMVAQKSLLITSDIRSLLESGISPPDGEEDESRRTVRVKEFCNRFSRNYLYPLAHQMEEIASMVAVEPNYYQKLLSAYQIGLNGLQAYHNHLPSSIGTCSSDRMKSLLMHLSLLCDTYIKCVNKEHDNFDTIKILKTNFELTLQKIDEHFSSTPKEPKPHQAKAVAFKRAENAKTTTNSKSKRNNLASRLSMYNVPCGNFKKDAYWRKMVEVWAKKRANVKSRYKTATFRHRPPIEKKLPEELQAKSKLFLKKSNGTPKRSPVTTPINEDNISTLVQVENSKEKGRSEQVDGEKSEEPAASSPVDHEGIVVKLLQLVLDSRRRREKQQGDDDGADAKVADILECLKAGEDVEVLKRMLEAVQEDAEPPNSDQLQLQIVRSHSNLEEATTKTRKEPRVTITGEKNARLICITDENSIQEMDETNSDDKDCSTEKEHVVLKGVSSTETQTHLSSNKINKSTQKANKSDVSQMKRLRKSSKCLKKLPKVFAVNIIQYKLDFHKHCKQNPMYKKTTSVQPWILMSKISDEILNFALLGVAREIEVNDIAQQVYDSELQL